MSVAGELITRFLSTTARQQNKRGILLVGSIGVLLSLCVVVVVFGILSGYQRVYRDAVLGSNAHLIVFRQSGGLSKVDVEKLNVFFDESAIKNKHTTYHIAEALMPVKTGFQAALFKGVEWNKIKSIYPLRYDFWSTDSDGVLVGKKMLELQPDILLTKKLRVIKENNDPNGVGTEVAYFKVLGTFESGYYEFDSKTVIMPLAALTKNFFDTVTVSGMELRLDDIERVDELKTTLIVNFPHEYDVLTWREHNSDLFEAFRLERTVVFMIAVLVILIASLNVFGFNFLLFLSKKKEFIVLSALGVRLSDLKKVLYGVSFVVSGISGFVGMFLGAMILLVLRTGQGIALDPTVYYVDRVPADLPYGWFVLSLIVMLVTSFLTSYFAGHVVIKRHMTSNLLNS